MGLDEEILADVLSAGQIQNLQPGDVLLKPSDWDVSLFIVIEGLVKVSRGSGILPSVAKLKLAIQTILK